MSSNFGRGLVSEVTGAVTGAVATGATLGCSIFVSNAGATAFAPFLEGLGLMVSTGAATCVSGVWASVVATGAASVSGAGATPASETGTFLVSFAS